MTRRLPGRVLFVATLVGAVTACGLKGPLELPEKSTNVVIRGPQAPAGTGTAPAVPTVPPAKPTTPPDDRMPPPPLPGGNPGSSRGG